MEERLSQPELGVTTHHHDIMANPGQPKGFTVTCELTGCDAGVVRNNRKSIVVRMDMEYAAPLIDSSMGQYVTLKVWDFAATPPTSFILAGLVMQNREGSDLVQWVGYLRRWTRMQKECEMLIATLFFHSDGVCMAKMAQIAV